MADYEDVGEQHGPALVFTTRFLRKGPRRIALRTQALAIPGTYELSKVIGAGVGIILGLILGFPIFAVTGTWLAIVAMATIGSMAGIFMVSWSPLKGESIMKWFILHTAKRNSLIEQNGGFVRAYVGGTVVQRSLFREAQMVRTYVEAESPQPGSMPAATKEKSVKTPKPGKAAKPRKQKSEAKGSVASKKSAATTKKSRTRRPVAPSVEDRVHASLPPTPTPAPLASPVGGGHGPV